MAIFPKCRSARIGSSPPVMSSSGKVLSMGIVSVPASTAGHRSARIRRTISRTLTEAGATEVGA
jgi:hypothetical protein